MYIQSICVWEPVEHIYSLTALFPSRFLIVILDQDRKHIYAQVYIKNIYYAPARGAPNKLPITTAEERTQEKVGEVAR